MDAAVATMFCLGVVNPVGAAIGGGAFINVYDRCGSRIKPISKEKKRKILAS